MITQVIIFMAILMGFALIGGITWWMHKNQRVEKVVQILFAWLFAGASLFVMLYLLWLLAGVIATAVGQL